MQFSVSAFDQTGAWLLPVAAAASPAARASIVVGKRLPDTRGVVTAFGLTWTSVWSESVLDTGGGPDASAGFECALQQV